MCGDSMKAQGSTEYLVILAVVLLIAFIIVSILGGFTGFGKEGKHKKEEIEWKSTYPISLEGFTVKNMS